MFEWQEYVQDSSDVPHFSALLEFTNLQAQDSKLSVPEPTKKHRSEALTHKCNFNSHPVTSMTIGIDGYCFVCNATKHSLYGCPKFRSLPHDQIMSLLKSRGLCLNCFKPGHFIKECTSMQHCRKCQKIHHTLLHMGFHQKIVKRLTKSLYQFHCLALLVPCTLISLIPVLELTSFWE